MARRILPIIPFAKWRPDAAVLLDQFSAIAKGCYPAPTGYRPFPILGTSAYLSALTARCQGAAAFISPSDQSPAIVAGDATKLYKNDGTTAANASGATYTIDATEFWEFVDFGGMVIATNRNDPIQSATMGGTSLFAAAATSTLKPQARHISVIGRQVHIGNTREGATDYPNRARWAGIDSAAVDFDVSQTTMADSQDLEGVGAIQKIVGGFSYGLYLCDEGIVRANFVGTPDIYTMDHLEPGRGCDAPGSVASWGTRVIFHDDEGFFMTDGLNSAPIGAEKVDTWFADNADPEYLHNMSATIDTKRHMYILSFTSTAATTPDTLLFFHIPTQEWAYASLNLEFLFSSRTPGVSMDGNMDGTPYAGLDMESITAVSMDASIWVRSLRYLAGFDTAHTMYRFDGTNMAAQIDTKVFEPNPGRRARINDARVIVDGGTPTVALAVRETLSDTETFATAVAQNANGIVPFDSSNAGRYAKARVTIPAASTWTHLEGVQPSVSPLGRW